MFPRIVKVKRQDGTVDEYIRLVESYRDKGRPRQRVVCNLGRKDLLEPHLEAIIKLLQPQKAKRKGISADDLDVGEQAPAWGRVLAMYSVWKELGVERVLDRLKMCKRNARARLADRSFVLVANRLCEPGSEHGLAKWIETEFVCDRHGSRWKPAWRDDEERKRSKRPRVRVKDRQLHQWYRTLDELQAGKKEIEQEMFLRLRDLFSLKPDMVLYDLTSTYFEGQGPEDLAFHGHSRDDKPRNRQVLVGVVMVDGWPIAHYVFRGNMRDSQTVEQVFEDLQERFGIRRVVFVGDRGMVTSDNLAYLKSREPTQGYLVGLNRRRSEQVYRYIKRATGPWKRCPVGITASEKTVPPKTKVQEVKGDEPGVRVFVVHSDERLEYERGLREAAMEKVRGELERLAKRVAEGKLKAPEKIGAAASKIINRNHGYRYYDWKLKNGRFHYVEHPVNLKREKALEGKYIIQTEEKNLGAVEAVQYYKELSEVERAFCDLKDVIAMRPIHHQTPQRVEAHIFVAALALLIQRGIEKKLKRAGVDISAKDALCALKTIQVVDIGLGNGASKRCVTRGTTRARQILSALDISDTRPPDVKNKGV
jgi:transposase